MLDFARLPRPVGNKMTGDTPTAAQLQAISDPFVRSLAGLGRLRTYPKNTVFITEGDSSDSVFVILSGRVKVFISDTEGHEMILDTQGPGEYVGEMALDGKPRSASVMTLEATTFSVVGDRKSTRLNSSHMSISYAVFCLKKKKKKRKNDS